MSARSSASSGSRRVPRSLRSSRPRTAPPFPRSAVADLHDRQRERDAGAALGTVLRPDPAAVRLDETAGDREPETGAAAAPRAVRPPEALEHPRRSFFRQAFAAVLDAQEQ